MSELKLYPAQASRRYDPFRRVSARWYPRSSFFPLSAFRVSPRLSTQSRRGRFLSCGSTSSPASRTTSAAKSGVTRTRRWFRHQLLLGRQRDSQNRQTDWPFRFEACEYENLRHQKRNARLEDVSKRQLPSGQTTLHRWCPNLTAEFQCFVRPDEVVITAEQLEVIFQTLLPPGLTDRSATQIG
jgi:hypothetical protein